MFATVILAAGRSIRMGRPKMLLPWGKTSVLGHLIEQWRRLGAHQIGIVCSIDDSAISNELERLGFPPENKIVNQNVDKGMFHSLQTASRWLGWQPDLSHWSIALGDQPHLRPRTLENFLLFGAKHSSRICQPRYAGHRCHPVMMPRIVFEQLAVSTHDNLQHFLDGFEVEFFEADDPGMSIDIDRPDDYEKALQMWKNEPSNPQPGNSY